MPPYDVQLELTGCEASAPGTVTHLLVQYTVLDNIMAPILELQAFFLQDSCFRKVEYTAMALQFLVSTK